MRQRSDHATGHDVFQLGFLRLSARSDQGLAHHQRTQQGLGHQATAQRLKHHG